MIPWRRRMTLDEAIPYCDEKAKEYKEKERYELMGEYLQFRAWVKELKRLRESERPTGEWINREAVSNTTFPFWERYECNKCHKYNGYSNFCPNCGADMRKE